MQRLSLPIHFSIYIALYFIGFIVGFQVSWFISLTLIELGIIPPSWDSFIITASVIIGLNLPKLVFAKTVPARCPNCGENAFLKWLSKPTVYVCSKCESIHKTGLSLRGY